MNPDELDRWITGGGEPPDHSQARCAKCSQTWEEHLGVMVIVGTRGLRLKSEWVCPSAENLGYFKEAVEEAVAEWGFEERDLEQEREAAQLAAWEARREG